MTITTTALGTYTTQISLSGELNGLNMIAAIDAAIVAAGWTQYDVTTLTKVYRILNKDAVTFKYIGIYIDPYNGKINTTSYESWNTTTHAGTNEVYTAFRTGECGYLLSNTDVIVMASASWCIIQVFNMNLPGPWSGVIELQRELPEDTSLPCHAWVCSTLIFNKTAGAVSYQASFPRTASGATGQAAALNTGWQTQFNKIGFPVQLIGSDFPTYTTDAWDTTKKNILSLRPTSGYTEVHGRAIGLKVAPSAYQPYNIVNVNTDANYNYSSTGTSTPHWVLGESYVNSTPSFATGTSNGFITSSTSSVLGVAPAQVTGIVNTGTNFYISTFNSTYKINSTTTTALGAVTTVAAGAGLDVVFDGRFVYVSTATGLSRFDTLSADAATALAITNGTSNLFWDGAFIWATDRSTVVNNQLYKIDPVTFTVSATITMPNATTAAFGGLCSDNAGNMYVAMLRGGTIYKVVVATGVATAFGTADARLGTIAAQSLGIMYDGVYLYTNCQNGSQFVLSVFNLAGVSVVSTILSTNNMAVRVTRASLFKYGQFICAGYQGDVGGVVFAAVTMNGYGTNGQLVNGISSTDTPLVIYSDGTRFFGGTASNMYQHSFINHPDDGATAHGRLVLPK